MFNLFKIFTLLCFFALPSLSFSASFSSSEHLAAGDSVKISFDDTQAHTQFILHLPNGLQLSYGDILTFGDLYGIPSAAISLGKTPDDKSSRFLAAFSSFADNPKSVSEANQLIQVIRNEKNLIDEGMRNGEEPETIYARLSNETGRQLNCITGGGCMTNGWWLIQGRYLKLASEDYDHFGDNAITAYQVGHAAALHQALLARSTHDRSLLELAYAMNAFASHFLSDRFAAGHIRPPRFEMSQQVNPSILGSLLVNFMHNEENAAGLHVHNGHGDHWITYGDRSYFSIKNDTNRTILLQALQLSADEIFTAYHDGILSAIDNTQALIPQADENANTASKDVSPLFYWDEKTKKIMRRSNLSDLYDHHWTSDWWGWSTFTELSRERGIPSSVKAILCQKKNSGIDATLILNMCH